MNSSALLFPVNFPTKSAETSSASREEGTYVYPSSLTWAGSKAIADRAPWLREHFLSVILFAAARKLNAAAPLRAPATRSPHAVQASLTGFPSHRTSPDAQSVYGSTPPSASRMSAIQSAPGQPEVGPDSSPRHQSSERDRSAVQLSGGRGVTLASYQTRLLTSALTGTA